MDYDIIESKLIRTISPSEKMIGAPPEMKRSEPEKADENHYFACGRSALEFIDLSLRAARMEVPEVKRILDLPCGHGRVLRYFRAAFPNAEVTACDVMRDGVDFCASVLSAVPIYSDDDPRKIPLGRDAFDLIWVGSLFTHLDSHHWLNFLDVFLSSLRPGGLLVFTTLGREAYRRSIGGDWSYCPSYRRRTILLHDYERTGFGYVRYPVGYIKGLEDKEYYGQSFSSPDWVFEQIAKFGRLRTVLFSERFWDNHQDCFACIRDDSFQANSSGISLIRYMKHRLGEVLKGP